MQVKQDMDVVSRLDKGKRTVDAQLRVSNDLLDLSLLLQIGKCAPCERAVDLQTVDERGDGDEAV